MPTDLDACGRYALSCQTDEGGFCFYSDPTWSVEVPNAPDTCAAIGILALRTIPVPRVEQCTAWLRSLQDADGEYPMLIVGYSALRALRVLRLAPRLEPRPYLCGWLDRFAASALPTDIPEGWLTSAARCVELCLACELELTQEMRAGIATLLQRSRSETGGYGAPGPSLPDSARALTLANAVGLALDDEILAYARQCEHEPFGFNITPFATSSSLETQHAGLTIMLSCGERPRNPSVIRAYVASCQSSRGGFGRAPGAIPRLDDSLRALQILSSLDDPGP